MDREYYHKEYGRNLLLNAILKNKETKELFYRKLKTSNMSNPQVDMLQVMSALEKEWKKRGIILGHPITNHKPFPDRKFQTDAIFNNYNVGFELDGTDHNKEKDKEKNRYFQQHGWTLIRFRSKSLPELDNSWNMEIADNSVRVKDKKQMMMYINTALNLDYIDYKKVLENVPKNRKDFLIAYNIENNDEFVDEILDTLNSCSDTKKELQFT